MKKIKVVCGVLVQDGKVLIAQRATGDSIGKFEFPGGKVEIGEYEIIKAYYSKYATF